MRKSREEAKATRKRIIEVAAREFREKGVVASGLADVMKAAGLTHGGFYKHFSSKDQLVAEAAIVALGSTFDAVARQPNYQAAVATYLSARHRDDPASGCLFAALGGELARADEATRRAATEGFTRLVELLAEKSATQDARRRAIAAASTMIGAMIVARVVTDPALSDEILRAAEGRLTEG